MTSMTAMAFSIVDGKKLLFINCKTRHLFLAGRKALDHRWTKVWRRAHKKESILSSGKKSKNKRTLKSERGIEGLSLQDLLRKKNESAEQRKKAIQEKKKAQAGNKQQTKQGRKNDLNARLRELRKKKKEKEDAENKGKKGAAKKGKSGGKKDNKNKNKNK